MPETPPKDEDEDIRDRPTMIDGFSVAEAPVSETKYMASMPQGELLDMEQEKSLRCIGVYLDDQDPHIRKLLVQPDLELEPDPSNPWMLRLQLGDEKVECVIPPHS